MNLQDKFELFSAIVPCKDEASAIPVFIEKFKSEIQKIENLNWEIIFIDDGSTDETLDVLKNFSAEDSRIRYISFSRNFGKEAAMLAGLKASQADYSAIMDADLQDPPELLPSMFEYIRSGEYQCVATRRKTRVGEPFLRTLGATLFYKTLNALSKTKFTEGARDFRLITAKVREAILNLQEYNRFLKGAYEYVGFKTKWIEFDNVPRVVGKTKWSICGLAIYSLEAITSYSTAPLAFVAISGIVLSLISVLAIIFLSIRQLLYHNSAFGWTSMICVILLLGGIQLFSLGAIGFYTSKIYLESKKRPHYVIKESNLK